MPFSVNLVCLGSTAHIDAGRQRILDRMRIAQAEHHRVLALHLGAVADADDFQVARPALGDAFDGVVDQGARQAMHRRLRIVFADRHQVAVFLLDLMPAGSGYPVCPSGPARTVLPSILTVTPLGIGIGFFPILDISSTLASVALSFEQGFSDATKRQRGLLPNLAENFAAHTFLARLPTRHHPAAWSEC